MYTMVLMAALSGSGDVASFGKKSSGCTGEAVASCHGGESCHGGGGFLGLKGKLGGGGLFSKHKSKGCDGGCHGAVVEPAPCCEPAPAPACCGHEVAPVHAAPVGCALPGAPIVVAPVTTAPMPMTTPAPKPEEKKPEEKKTTGSGS